MDIDVGSVSAVLTGVRHLTIDYDSDRIVCCFVMSNRPEVKIVAFIAAPSPG